MNRDEFLKAVASEAFGNRCELFTESRLVVDATLKVAADLLRYEANEGGWLEFAEQLDALRAPERKTP